MSAWTSAPTSVITPARFRGWRVHAVEPVAPVRKVLSRNLRRCGNVEIYPFALGTENKPVRMGNDSARTSGYLGTGQNFVNDTGGKTDVEFTAEMRRGSELFAHLPRLDFVKCDIEGYELTVLIETGGENRPAIIGLFRAMGYDGFTLDRGREVPLDPDRDNGKDIVFRPRP